MKSTPAGLTAGNKPVPLLGVRYDVVVENVASRVTIAQRFRNTESQPIEAMYTFPLDEGSAVCAFEVEIGERRVIGRVEEREAAFERYDQAIADGDGAFLLDQDRPNIFTASVGNLKPNEEAVVRVSYVAEIEQRGDELRLQIPTTVSPRYVPASQLRAIDPADQVAYKGMMLSGVPNMAFYVGYTNASWTLKCDLVSAYVCRLLRWMDERGYAWCMPRAPGPGVELSPVVDLAAGYVLRALDRMPKQGSRAPWRLRQNYPYDLAMLRWGPIEDEGIEFHRARHRRPAEAVAM